MVEKDKDLVFLGLVLLSGIISLVISISRLDPIWIAMSVFYIFLMYGLTKIEETFYREINLDTLKKDLFIITTIPLAAGSAGLDNLLEGSLVLGNIAFIFLSAFFAFIILLIIDELTSFRSNRLLAVLFVISFTIFTGTLFIFIRFFTDLYMGTSYVSDNTYLMVYLLFLSILSIILGLGINRYILSSEYFMLENLRKDTEVEDLGGGVRKEFLHLLNFLFGRHNNFWLDLTSRLFQLGIMFVVLYGIHSSRRLVISWGLFSLIFAFSPDLFKINTDLEVPSLITIWITAVTFIFAFGRAMRFYGNFFWWSDFTHFLAGSAVAILLFPFYMYANKKIKNLFIPIWLLLLLVLLSIFPIGIVWEMSEFLIDSIYQTRLQAGLDDTIYDLISNFLGSLFTVAVLYSAVSKDILKLEYLSL